MARQLLDAMRRHGARTVFGLPGVHNLAFWRDPGDAPVVVRHEQAAVYAADGWARRTGRLGAAVVTTGPGAANTVAAFGEAAAAGSPVLLVASEIPEALRRPGRLRGVLHESRDQAALFAPLAKAVFRPRNPAEVASAVDAAVATALREPRGPVYLDVPADVLGEAAAPRPETAMAPEPLPDDADLDAAATLLRGARVVLWAGQAAVGAAAGVAALAERLGAPVVTSYQARGMPGALGVPPHEPEVAELIEAADVLLAVGGDLDGMNTRNWTMPRPERLVTVEPAAPADPPEWDADAAVAGRMDRALAGLLARIPKHPEWAPGDLRKQVLDRLRTDPATAEAVALLDAVDAARTPDTMLVCDMAVGGYWVGGYASVPAPRGLAYPVGWGTLGFGLPAALGAAAAGGPVLAVCGDGGLAMGLGELATLVQERLPVTVLVIDDGGYGMLRYDQDRAGAPHAGVDLVTPDFIALAAAFGLPATDVPAIEDGLSAALGGALRGGPHLVRVPARLLPPRTTSPRWHEG
ncbi:acetolactate synthase I/II/III large subunit [Pseudonocardia asaccharolytica DSM 44247 = NBRC 16224]|uniref:Acetolactate synthase I/II/III large subunit n=1 Tax=Pseudonocardia asaccharolytica DSM 44247 = NBRC 16224 TaxID=1123024 RepID=A0A511DB15_9PSEU|nr:acetolactate synthase I/II/III large subunit [Pseudonocardia asaccharolytica DSM 44247 = NBRC 16224]